MQDFIITTDNMADLPPEYIKEHDLREMYLTYLLEGVNYDETNGLEPHAFYEKMRAGSMPTTSQVPIERAKEAFSSWVEVCPNILHLAFSSGLSGTYSSAFKAAEQLMEERPDCHITVIDTLCASMGQGLIVHKAVMMKEKGASLEEIAAWVEENKKHVVHSFTVDDLFHLHRGGRVSKTTAILGTMINIKPVMHVDDEGKLVAVGKVRGRKKAIQALADSFGKQAGSWKDKNDIVFISHGDCLDDALYLKKLVEKQYGIHEFLIYYVGPTIGAHSGPGTLTLMFMGDVR